MFDYQIIRKCELIAQKYSSDDAIPNVEKNLAKDPSVKSIQFRPADNSKEYPEYCYDESSQTCKALIPIKNGPEHLAILSICFTARDSKMRYEKEEIEHMCQAFNRFAEKVSVRKGTQWGDVELRQIEMQHYNYYRPDGAVIYTNRIIQYLRPEEIDQIIEKDLNAISYKHIKFIDEHFELNYPLFKLRIKLCDAEKLSHEQDADGVWWVNCPRSYVLSRSNVQWYLRDYFKKVLTSAAAAYIPGRTAYMENQMRTGKIIRGFEFKYITTRNAIAWNSCEFVEPGSTCDDGTRTLRFDPILMAYPKQYCDKVIIHELCHNWILQHNKAFYDLEAKWSLAITGKGPHYYDDFFETHKFILFAEEPWEPTGATK